MDDLQMLQSNMDTNDYLLFVRDDKSTFTLSALDVSPFHGIALYKSTFYLYLLTTLSL